LRWATAVAVAAGRWLSTLENEAITALTDDGIGELRDMLADAQRSTQHWHDFLEDFVSDPDIIGNRPLEAACSLLP